MLDNKKDPAAAPSLQIFFRSERAEPDVMNAFARITSIAVDSIDFPAPDACAFAMFTRYAEGFELGVLMSWPSAVPLMTPEPDLVEQLAASLKTTVLLESAGRPGTWLTASATHACSETGVEYLEDGIDLK